ncbi:TPR-like protein [Cristinia sonorae]|uniref:TPR-like protein n=1 Tax=Cristinia sonorae TaxID=1940300 RepID=A0A8K0URU9_9AGAR|nr:TPR-like protein [Cristinia sonorae]
MSSDLSDTLQHDDSHEHEATAVLDDTQIQRLLDEANDLKLQGNEHFRKQSWDEALGVYRSALGKLPKRKVRAQTIEEKVRSREPEDTKGKGRDTGEEVDEVDQSSSPEPPAEPEPEPTELERECAKARAVLNSNIGACFVKLGDHKEVVHACTEALHDDPTYVRALQRRATSNEQIGSWSALSSAQEDYTKLLDLLPPTSPQLSETKRALLALKPRVEAAQKRETDEMLDKLKGLGNSILGNFGLSTNNFQFTPNGQGGYSMNFVRCQ